VKRTLFFALLPLLSMTVARADDPGVIATMDEARFQPKNGRTRLVEGRSGRALEFHLDKDTQGGFATSNIRGTPEWDRADGFSFWVKGDGSVQFAGL
jgi:hypothetical protein